MIRAKQNVNKNMYKIFIYLVFVGILEILLTSVSLVLGTFSEGVGVTFESLNDQSYMNR